MFRNARRTFHTGDPSRGREIRCETCLLRLFCNVDAGEQARSGAYPLRGGAGGVEGRAEGCANFVLMFMIVLLLGI